MDAKPLNANLVRAKYKKQTTFFRRAAPTRLTGAGAPQENHPPLSS